MKTQQEYNQNSPAPLGKIKFLEYSTANKGQHFITVIQGKNNIEGRIFREYDDINKKAVYTAKDTQGNPVFTEEQTLAGIKKRFVLAQKEMKTPEQDPMDPMDPMNPMNENDTAPLKVSKCNKREEREYEIKKLRALKNHPEKNNEINL